MYSIYNIKNASKKLDNNFFSYDDLSKKLWFECFKKAKDFYHIVFDLENNTALSQKVININNTENKDEPFKFKCELMVAAGDWENSCYYFKCQAQGAAKYIENYEEYFIVIPNEKQGNLNLIKDGDNLRATHNGETKGEEINERTPWKYIEELITHRFDKD